MVTSKRLERDGRWMTPARLAKLCGGRVVRSGGPARGAATDSREVVEGSLFVAMIGQQQDGHGYLASAFENGASGALVSQTVDRTTIPDGRFVVRVDDTSEALLKIAKEHRERHDARIVGVTGSCGKTSTKDMLGRVLASAMPTVFSPKSYNNHVGVPLSILQIEPDTAAAVIEVGTNGPGEIAALASIAQPDIGIVTRVSEAHLAGLGSLDGVRREKAGLLAKIRDGGVAILNGDDRSCRKMAEDCKARVVFVSAAEEADWFATDVRFCSLGTTFRLQGDRQVTLPRLGTHNVYNALMAIAAATEIGMGLDEILEALSGVEPSSRRMERRQCGEVTILDDTYNMNPDSSRAALATMSALAGVHRGGRKIVVFGEMLELGERSDELHHDLGARVARSEVDLLVTVGDGATRIADGAVAEGLPAEAIVHQADIESAYGALMDVVRAGDLVLCKASRRVGLERLVDRMMRELPERQVAQVWPG